MSRPDRPTARRQKPLPQAPRAAGLRTPRGPLLGFLERPRRFSPGKAAAQLLGFAIGLGLLGYSVHLAFSTPESREGLGRLASAGAGDAIALLGLAALSVVLNGLAFWAALTPVRRLRIADVVAVNALSTVLSYLPFKISALARVFIHRRRDHMPFRQIIAWFASMAALSVGALGLLAALAWWGGGMSWTIAAAYLAALAVFGAACIVGGRIASGAPKLDALTLGAGRMLRSAPAVAGALSLRVADIAAQTARFLVVAAMLGHELPVADAALLATTYFMMGIISVAGILGVREGAVIGVGALSAGAELGAGAFASMALVVTAAEAAAQIALAPGAFLWLRPDRLFRRAEAAPATKAAGGSRAQAG